MKNNYILGAFLFSTFLSAQLNFTPVNIKTTDMLYDKKTDRIYVAIASTNGSNGNSIGVINPHTKSLESTVYVGSDPTVLAISDDSKYIYVGFSGTSTVRRYNVDSKTAEIQFSLGSNTSGPLYANDIKVMPGTNTTIAVSKMQGGTSAPFKGVAIYDEGVQRPTVTMNPNNFTYDSADKIVFPESSLIYGLSTSFSSSQPFRKISVTSNGATDTNSNVYGLTSTARDIEFFENKIYATNGQVVDNLGSNAYLSGTYNSVNGAFSIDSSNRIISFISYYPQTFKRFNLDTYTLIDTTEIQDSENKIATIYCGAGCYAFSTANKIYFATDPILQTGDLTNTSNFTVFPNPASDFININLDKNIKIINIKLADSSGRIIINKDSNDNKLSLKGLKKGLYYITVQDNYGRVHHSKIIKD